MRPITYAVVKAGLVSEGALAELKRWGMPVEVMPVDESEIIDDPKKIVEIIQEALESHAQVRVQDTDLDILHRFLDPSYQREGKLVIAPRSTDASFRTLFCFTAMGEVAIPWRSESIYDLMTDGDTYFAWTDNAGTQRKSYFSDVRELFVGDRKAFMVCTPVEEAK